jgi:hypothetical protein
LQTVSERVGKLKNIRGERRRSSLAEANGKAGQAAKLNEAALRQPGCRPTWMGPEWMGSSLEQVFVAVLPPCFTVPSFTWLIARAAELKAPKAGHDYNSIVALRSFLSLLLFS